MRVMTPPVTWDPFFGMKFSTPSARIEFYCERLAPVGGMMAEYREPFEVPTTASPRLGQERRAPVPVLQRAPALLHAVDVHRRPGDGEDVGRQAHGAHQPRRRRARGHRGRRQGGGVQPARPCVADMRLDQAIPPGTIQVWFGWRRGAFEEGMYSELIVPLGGKETIDEYAELWWKHVEEEGRVKAGFATGGTGMFAGAWDTIWGLRLQRAQDRERGIDHGRREHPREPAALRTGCWTCTHGVHGGQQAGGRRLPRDRAHARLRRGHRPSRRSMARPAHELDARVLEEVHQVRPARVRGL